MKFRVEQRFTAPAADCLGVYLDRAFYDQLHGLTKIGRPEVLDRVENPDGQHVEMRVRYHFIGDLPMAAQAVLDPAKLTWIEETVYDLTTLSAVTRLVPDHYADRLVAAGKVSFVPDPFDEAHSRRVVEGDVEVRMPFVGGQVERAIISGLSEHLADEERSVAEWLRS